MTETGARFGLFGWPLQRTFSPDIHNAAFAHLGIAARYHAWPVTSADLPAALDGLRGAAVAGANVTIPHKRRATGLVDERDDVVAAVGALNTLVVRAGRLVGFNTDVEGFAAWLVDSGTVLDGRRVVIVGSGGAARAVAHVAGEKAAPAEVVVVGRNEEETKSVAALAKGRPAAWDEGAAAVAAAGVVVNATPTQAAAHLLSADLSPAATVIDLNYGPETSALLAAAIVRGCVVHDGLGMLVWQAAASFRLFTGEEPPLAIMWAAARRAAGH